jgi:hypothetical protein
VRVIEGRVGRAAFAEVLASMRSWLDHNDRPLVRFETKSDSSTIWVRVQFEDNALADAFAKDFGGAVV